MTTLRIADPDAALALVSARPAKPDTKQGTNGTSPAPEEGDQDLNRAKDLLSLHGTVKLAHQDGTDKELNEAREAVAKVLSAL